MSTLVRCLVLAVRGLLVIVLVLPLAAVAGLLIWHLQGVRLLSVQTGSMVPAFGAGDTVIMQPVRLAKIKPGDVISYHSSFNKNLIISHRLIAINHRTGWLTTKGDALATADPPFPPSLVIGQVTTVAPGLGKVLDILRRPLGLSLAVYLPAVLILTVEIKYLINAYTYKYYSLTL